MKKYIILLATILQIACSPTETPAPETQTDSAAKLAAEISKDDFIANEPLVRFVGYWQYSGSGRVVQISSGLNPRDRFHSQSLITQAKGLDLSLFGYEALAFASGDAALMVKRDGVVVESLLVKTIQGKKTELSIRYHLISEDRLNVVVSARIGSKDLLDSVVLKRIVNEDEGRFRYFQYHNEKTVEFLKTNFANVEIDSSTCVELSEATEKNANHETFLYAVKEAIEWGKTGCVKKFVEKFGTDVNNAFEWLHAASKMRNAEMVTFLLHRGASVASLNGSGRTPLQVMFAGFFETQAKFGEHGSVPITTNFDKVAHLLVDAGSSLIEENENGLIPSLIPGLFAVNEGLNANLALVKKILAKIGATPIKNLDVVIAVFLQGFQYRGQLGFLDKQKLEILQRLVARKDASFDHFEIARANALEYATPEALQVMVDAGIDFKTAYSAKAKAMKWADILKSDLKDKTKLHTYEETKRIRKQIDTIERNLAWASGL